MCEGEVAKKPWDYKGEYYGGSRSFKRWKFIKFCQVEVSQRSFFLSMTLPTFSFEPYEVCFSITEETWFSTVEEFLGPFFFN